MPEKKMQQVFADALIAEAYIMEYTVQQDSQKKLATKYYSEIFDKYHITKDDYFRSYDFYVHHPALFETIMGPVIDSLSAMEARIPVRPVQPLKEESSKKSVNPHSTLPAVKPKPPAFAPAQIKRREKD